MPTIPIMIYNYLCPFCGKMRKKEGYIPGCKVCGEFVCKKCSEKEVCFNCLSKLNPDQLKLFKKKGKKKKILNEIFQHVYGPKFIISAMREVSEEDIMALKEKLMSFEDATAIFLKLRNTRVQDTYNPNLWQ